METNPPAIGFDFIKGIKADDNDGIDNDRDGTIDEANEEIKMSNFVYYNNDANPQVGNPSTSQDHYNYMRSIWRDNTPITYGNYGQNGTIPCKYMFPGNSDAVGWGVGGTTSSPNPQAEWTEQTAGNSPADRRFLMSAGPFTFSSGEVSETQIAVVWSRNYENGALGSVAKLLTDNDYIQSIINKNGNYDLAGPRVPNVGVTTSTNGIILTITPVSYLQSYNGQVSNVTTETHQEDFNGDVYSFQGYQVFQLKDSILDITSLNHPNLAKQVAQCDKVDAIESITNADGLGSVIASNTGIVHTFTITHDAFTGAALQLNKRYFYVVVPYMVSDNVSSTMRYWKGCRNGKVVSSQRYSNGNNPSDQYYWSKGVEIKRLKGTGNSGNYLKLKSESENEILTNNFINEPVYQKRYSPINVSIDDISVAANKQFKLELSSRLVYENTNGVSINVGDTLIAKNFPTITRATDTAEYRPGIVHIPAKAVVNRIVATDANKVTLDIKLVNDHLGGTFKLLYDSLIFYGWWGQGNLIVHSHKEKLIPFYKQGSTDTLQTLDFEKYDYWKLLDYSTNDSLYSQYPISEEEEQLVPTKGISVYVRNRKNASHEVFNPKRINPLIGCTTSYVSQSWAWQKETVDFSKWIDGIQSTKYDPEFYFKSMIDKGWTPYFYSKNFLSNGPAYFNSHNYIANSPNVSGQLDRLKNVDIVYTDDKTKWTEVVVLQYDPQGTILNPPYKLNKSLLPSVDKNFSNTGSVSTYSSDSISRGKSWFPGYAIDLDRGVRLNMMFSESKLKDPTLGNNLQWNPGYADSLNSFVYVLNSVYDSCKTVEYVLDSIRYTAISLNQIQTRLNNAWASFEIMYVGNVQLNTSSTVPLQTEARTSIRVSREYQSYNKTNAVGANPEYIFTIPPSISGVKNDISLVKDISIYPNPTSGRFTLNFNSDKKITSLKVVDMSGKIIEKHTSLNSNSLNMSHLPSGMYILRIETDSGDVTTEKLIIEK
jgi:hypothetical protein